MPCIVFVKDLASKEKRPRVENDSFDVPLVFRNVTATNRDEPILPSYQCSNAGMSMSDNLPIAAENDSFDVSIVFTSTTLSSVTAPKGDKPCSKMLQPPSNDLSISSEDLDFEETIVIRNNNKGSEDVIFVGEKEKDASKPSVTTSPYFAHKAPTAPTATTTTSSSVASKMMSLQEAQRISDERHLLIQENLYRVNQFDIFASCVCNAKPNIGLLQRKLPDYFELRDCQHRYLLQTLQSQDLLLAFFKGAFCYARCNQVNISGIPHLQILLKEETVELLHSKGFKVRDQQWTKFVWK